MAIKWTETETVKLVVLYGRHECLRNPFHPDFNKQLSCYKAYKQIVHCMNIPGLTVCDCVKRISFVKKQYCFELSKISAAISRGSFYKPKASWFEMMHELLFPYIQSESEYNEDSQKDCYCSQDEEGDGDRCDDDNQAINDCECPPCECPASVDPDPESEPAPCMDGEIYLDLPNKQDRRSKSRLSKNRGFSKSPIRSTLGNYFEKDCIAEIKRSKTPLKFIKHGKMLLQTDHGTNTTRATSDKGNEVVVSAGTSKCAAVLKKCIDVGNRTSVPYMSQSGAQTERQTLINAQTSFQCTEKGKSTMTAHRSVEDVCIDSVEDKGKKNKHHDEFDMFGKSIACQLRSLNLESAINLEKRIQNMMTEERLCSMKESVIAKSYSKACSCDYNDCTECCTSEKDQMCACGLPVDKCLPPFPIKPSQCYGFGCN